jgi:hypothetical protein
MAARDIAPTPGSSKPASSTADRFLTWLVQLRVVSGGPPFDLEPLRRAYFDDYVRRCDLTNWHTVTFQHPQTLDNFRSQPLMGSIHLDIARTGRRIPASSYHEQLLRRAERVLFVFATVEQCRYIQGFNELLATLFSVCCSSSDDRDGAEAAAYHMFRNLMVDGGMLAFYASMSDMSAFDAMRRSALPREERILQNLGITPLHYAVRWFTVLFSQDYDADGILVIWDVLLGHFPDICRFAMWIGVATVETVSGRFDEEDFQTTLDAMQHISGAIDPKGIAERAEELAAASDSGVERMQKPVAGDSPSALVEAKGRGRRLFEEAASVFRGMGRK